MPECPIGAGDRGHCLSLIDSAEQCSPHRHIIKGRKQMVEAQDARGRRILGNYSNIAVAGERLDLVVERHLPPVDFSIAKGGHCRELIQY